MFAVPNRSVYNIPNHNINLQNITQDLDVGAKPITFKNLTFDKGLNKFYYKEGGQHKPLQSTKLNERYEPTVKIIPSVFQEKNTEGDFLWEIQNNSKPNALYIFNDNTVDHKSAKEGAGNAAIRPYNTYGNNKNIRSAGICTGDENGGFKVLDNRVKQIIRSNVFEIEKLLNTRKYNQIVFSSDGKNGLGTSIFKVNDEVKKYILVKIYNLGKRLVSRVVSLSLPSTNISVVVKYISLRDKEIEIINLLKQKQHINLNNIIRCKIHYPVQINDCFSPCIRLPIIMYRYNGDLRDFSYPSLKTFHSFLSLDQRTPQVGMLAFHLARTYQNLMQHGFYYTDSKPANVLYHWIHDKRNVKYDVRDKPFKFCLADLGGMVVINSEQTIYPNPQTYPYPSHDYIRYENGEQQIIGWKYDKNAYHKTHEKRKSHLEKVVVWGLGILLFRMCLQTKSLQELFEQTFSHSNLSFEKYNDFIEYIRTFDRSWRRDRHGGWYSQKTKARQQHLPDDVNMMDVPTFIFKILDLKITSINTLIREIKQYLQPYYNKKKHVQKRKDRVIENEKVYKRKTLDRQNVNRQIRKLYQ